MSSVAVSADPIKRRVIFAGEPRCELLAGDCLQILPTLATGSIDAIITDPPYGMERAEWDGKDFKQELAPRMVECARVLKPGGWMFVFTSTAEVLGVGNLVPLDFRRLLWVYKPADCTYPWRGWLLKSEAILCYSQGAPQALVERVPYRHDVYLANRIGKEGVEGHPTVKPLAVVADLVSRVEGTILDPYSGSGTTGVACARLGRRFIGIDKDLQSFQIGVERITEARYQAGNRLPFEQSKPDEQLSLL